MLLYFLVSAGKGGIDSSFVEVEVLFLGEWNSLCMSNTLSGREISTKKRDNHVNF